MITLILHVGGMNHQDDVTHPKSHRGLMALTINPHNTMNDNSHGAPVCVFACMCTPAVCAHVCMYTSVCTCVCKCVHACMCSCVFISVCVHVCVPAYSEDQSRAFHKLHGCLILNYISSPRIFLKP